MAGLSHSMDFTHDQRQWISPVLIEANQVLLLSRAELQAAMRAEIMKNPALELDFDSPTGDETRQCPICGEALHNGWCAMCHSRPQEAPMRESYEEYADQWYTASPRRNDGDDDAYDPFTAVASEEDLRRQWLADAGAMLPEDQIRIAAFLIVHINERGILDTTIAETALACECDEEMALNVLQVVQSIVPVGVAARDYRESFLLQLRGLREGGMAIPETVEQIIAEHLSDLAAGRFAHIAGTLGVATETVEEARAFIRSHLTPHPLQSPSTRAGRKTSAIGFLTPDVLIREDADGELVAFVPESGSNRLRINETYSAIASDRGMLAGLSEQEREHIRESVARARLFLHGVRQRGAMLQQVAQYVIEEQEDFLRYGVRELKPLTRAAVAQALGVHESTVSRATANKYVLLPERRVIPFSDFFTASLGVKDVIKELVDREEHPLTDDEICDKLKELGIQIARRTVAKYRGELGLLPSTMR
ncbi:MAG: RNA polymerase factor sigma-54 [Thermomicrobiales bacterium]